MPSKFPYEDEFEKYLLKVKNFKPISLQTYINTIEMLFAYMKQVYKKPYIEPLDVKPSDIKGFLKNKHDQGIATTTLNKYLAILKTYFNYMWELEKIGVDPAVKIKTFKSKLKDIQITYNDLLKLYPKIVYSPNYSNLIKCLFILAMKGLRFSEFHFKKDDVVENKSDVLINTKKRVVKLSGEEATIFMTFYIESQFNPGEFVFTTKRQHTGEYVAIESDSLYTYIGYLRKDFNLSNAFCLDGIRKAYAFYLVDEKDYTVDALAKELGITKFRAAALIQESIETKLIK